MIVPILITINTIIFSLIALLHVYWVFGGNWGLEAAIPEKYMGTFQSNRTKMNIATLVVAFGLFSFALITLLNYSPWNKYISGEMVAIGTGIIGTIFLLRAIGDFNVCGFFKKDKEGLFAQKDSQIFSPLCLFISIVSFLILFLKLF